MSLFYLRCLLNIVQKASWKNESNYNKTETRREWVRKRERVKKNG